MPKHQSKSKLSCVIIGDGTLPLKCAEILIGEGHELCVLVTSDDKNKKWCRERGIQTYPTANELLTGFSQPIDYLFSIVNQQILSEAVIKLPLKAAINYHDGPLPRYAGTHATSWALINQERSHGITWHLITDVVDAGDILKQKAVDVDETETAHSLNTKCYEAAMEAFGELIDELAADDAKPRPQNLTERTFFPRFKRPPNGGVIRWDSPASEISAMIRALDFGPHPNPLGVAKFRCGHQYLSVSAVKPLPSTSGKEPGTILTIAPDFLDIATGSQDIRLRNFSRLDGPLLAITELQNEFSLEVGQKLPIIDSELAIIIEDLYARSSRHEAFWVQKLSKVERIDLEFLNRPFRFEYSVPRYSSTSVRIPEVFLRFARSFPSSSTGDRIFGALGIFLARITGTNTFDMGYEDCRKDGPVAFVEGVFARQVPAHFDIDPNLSFNDNFASFEGELGALANFGSFAIDAAARYPAIRGTVEAGKIAAMPISVIRRKSNEPPFADFDNDLIFVLTENSWECVWHFDASKVNNEILESLSDSFSSFLSEIATAPSKQVAKLSLLSNEERKEIVIDWNSTGRSLLGQKCVHELFIECAARMPNAEAITDSNGSLSYAELNRKSNQIAHMLRSLGVVTESLVAVYMERSAQAVTALLGILKAGAAFLPLDPANPVARTEFMLRDSAARVVLTQETLREGLQVSDCRVISIDGNESTSIVSESTDNPPSDASLGNLAYVIYTSGSSGRPKGVEIEHAGLLNLIDWHNRTYSISNSTRATWIAGPAFDASVWEIWPYLAAGGSLHIPDVETRSSPPKLFRWLADREITICFLPTPLAEAILDLPIPSGLKISRLLTGGDRLHSVHGLEMPFELINHYGPTENSVVTTCDPVSPGEKEDPTIGRPIQNVQVYILDRNLQPVPKGVPGEVHIGGAGLARGYRNDPLQTSEKFVQQDFGSGAIRLYKTGDRAKFQPDGRIRFLGRIDDQVKIRGFRIELNEIEKSILDCPDISQAVVVASQKTDHKFLVGYIVGAQDLDIQKLRGSLEERLPDYMVPSVFMQLDSLPITPNGKVDRTALPVPSDTSLRDGVEFVAANTEIERALVEIWERLLSISPIGIRDNFFTLGGDSLVSVTMFVEIEGRFGIDLPLSVLINSPTIEKLAEQISGQKEPVQWKYIVPLQSEGSEDPVFCVHAAGGNVLFYRDLANELGEDQPFYGVQARGVADKSETAHDNIEEMARDYLAEIQSMHPDGPYHLCGASFGGLVAFEAARQLREAEATVATLSVFDTYAPGYVVPTDDIDRGGRLGSLVFRAKGIRNQLSAMDSWKQRAAFVGSKASKVRKQIKRKIAWTKNQFAIEYNKATGRELPQNMMRNHAAIRKAMDSYMPGKFDGDLLIFRASEQPSQKVDRQLGWKEFVNGEITVVDVKGQHGALTVYPFASDLAEKYRPFLSVAPAVSANVKEVESAAVAVA